MSDVHSNAMMPSDRRAFRALSVTLGGEGGAIGRAVVAAIEMGRWTGVGATRDLVTDE